MNPKLKIGVANIHNYEVGMTMGQNHSYFPCYRAAEIVSVNRSTGVVEIRCNQVSKLLALLHKLGLESVLNAYKA